MSRLLITGGAGFIGSHLASLCVNKGHKVTIIDNMSRGEHENIFRIKDKIDLYNVDILFFDELESIIEENDVIFHLAALSRVIPSITDPESCFINNIQTTERILRFCAKYKKKIIFSSSREVYGTGMYLPVDEDHPIQPENPYGASKAAGEAMIRGYSNCFNFQYGIIRLANVYGPGDFDRVIPIFIKNSLNKEQLIVYGKEKVIDFVYIDDVIEAFYRSLFTTEHFIINIGSGIGYTIFDIARIIQTITGIKNPVLIKDERQGEVDKYIANIQRAQKILGWSPTVSIEEGIQEIIHTYSSNM